MVTMNTRLTEYMDATPQVAEKMNSEKEKGIHKDQLFQGPREGSRLRAKWRRCELSMLTEEAAIKRRRVKTDTGKEITDGTGIFIGRGAQPWP